MEQITRREWLALSGLVLSSACARRKGTGFPGYALVATSGEQSVGVVDLTQFRPLRSIPVGAPPTAVVAGGPGDSSYALTPATGSIHIIDNNLRVIRSRRLAGELSEIRLTPDRKRLLAISAQSHELIEADSVSLDVIRRHRLGAAPISLDISETGYVAVSTGSVGTAELFQLTNSARERRQFSGPIGPVRFRPDGKLLLVANFHDRCLTALEVPSLGVVADLSLAMTPENLCFTTDQGGQLFVSGKGMDGIAIVFPYRTIEVEQTVLAGRDPGVMACSDNPRYLFVASNSGQDVSVMNVENRRVIGIVDIAERPTYITITPDSQYALILSEATGMLAVIRIPAIAQSPDAGYNFRRKAGAALFTVVSVGDKPVHAAVMPRVT